MFKKKSMTYVFGHDGVMEIEFTLLPQITRKLDRKEKNQESDNGQYVAQHYDS